MSASYIAGNDPAAVKTIAERFGFCLIRGVFTPDETAALEREIALRSADYPGGFPDLYSVPSLKWVVTDGRIQALARALVGEPPVYYRLTSVAYEPVPGPLTEKPYNEFHCDARGMPHNLFESWNGDGVKIYPGYRFAIYFRDYSNASGGLKVAVNSHRGQHEFFRQFHFPEAVQRLPQVVTPLNGRGYKLRTAPFELFNVPSMPGDVVIFNLRTFHSAGAFRFKDRPDLAVLPAVEKGLAGLPHGAELRVADPPGARNAVFMDFCSPDGDVDLYIKWRAWTMHDHSPNAADRPTLKISNTQPFAGLRFRNDISIVENARALQAMAADRKIDLGTAQGLGDLPDGARDLAQTLLTLCETHEEFSPYHPLFDIAAFRRIPGDNAADRLRIVLSGLERARAAAQADRTRVTVLKES